MASAIHKPSERFTLEPLISNQSVRISGRATTSSFDKNAINASPPAAASRLRVNASAASVENRVPSSDVRPLNHRRAMLMP